jgi:hypothetical protein
MGELHLPCSARWTTSQATVGTLVPAGERVLPLEELRLTAAGRARQGGATALRSILRGNDEAGKRTLSDAGLIHFLELSTFAFALQEIKTVKALALRAMSAVFNSTPLLSAT